MNGLIRGDCVHEEKQWEYIGDADREETWRCLGCGETILRPVDCSGG